MIDNPLPEDWRALQNGVCRLFNEIGLNANTEVELSTPRGTVVVDVYAVDEGSVDKIKYIVECKNWNAPIPQTVVHAFTTVMHETGANIGYIVSKAGLQSGALRYTENTTITGLTYQALQERYFNVWWHKYFCINAGAAAEYVNQYVEPINTHRSRFLEKLTEDKLARYIYLHDRYAAFGMLMWLIDIGSIVPEYAVDAPPSLEEYKAKLNNVLGDEFTFRASTYRDLLAEICAKLVHIEEQFNEVFGRNIFEGEGGGVNP
ncbi:MAG: restriction endonuclease [Geobacteraceae bacterium]|nr:restriction endonuclease [Geobacteraceae bacterium]